MPPWRLQILRLVFLLLGFLVIFRLFYWQIVQGERLSALAFSQRFYTQGIPAPRGKIFSNDNFPLATNQAAFLAYALLPQLKIDPAKIASKLISFLISEENRNDRKKLDTLEGDLKEKLLAKERIWVPLASGLDKETKKKIESLEIEGLGFEDQQKRFYPEASMSAHLLGFVGKDVSGQDKGYFGLEGFYNRELQGQPGLLKQEKDAFGKPILIGTRNLSEEVSGRDLTLHLHRGVQFMTREKLEKGLARYGAKAGSVIVLDPKTGGVLAMVSLPDFDPNRYSSENEVFFSNPVISESFEPGSIFKVLVMSGAIDSGVVKPQNICPVCDGPRKVDKYVIKTWNDQYYPDSTMIEIIKHSDNVGMTYVAEKLGVDKLTEYLKKFGIGEATGVDLEGEQAPKLREPGKWSIVDLYTTSFGQGVAVTGIQMATAVAAIANQGILMQPQVVSQIRGNDKIFEVKPRAIRRVVSPEAAKVITEMMVNAVEQGEAKWTKLPGFRIAGKTGTAQIPIAGHYDEQKTIASFVGFAPADNPAFAMLVTLREPTSSPWASETAAPLWFEIAKELFFLLNISP